MSKPPAKSAKTTKASADASASVSKAVTAKGVATQAAAPTPASPKPGPSKPASSKPASAKPAAAEPVAPKPAAKSAKPAPKAPSKPVAAAPGVAKAGVAPKPATSKAPIKAPVAQAAVVPAPAPKSASKPSGKSASAPLMAQPAPAPMANRFTDRFGPAAKPLPRPMTETAELPKPAQKIDPKLVNAWKTKAGRELSEPELLAMPEAEYMNEKQIDFFRFRLQQQKDELLSSAGETTEHLREDTSIVPDPVDRATIEEEHALELRTRDRERKLLKKIAQSLNRLDTGEYGFCDETSEPIGLQRLLARPTATLSLEAQQRRELKQKMFGD